jgi:hypothetical protein
MILSFYMDDTSLKWPDRKHSENYPVLSFTRDRGESYLGYAGTSMVREPDTGHRSFLRLVKIYAKDWMRI